MCPAGGTDPVHESALFAGGRGAITEAHRSQRVEPVSNFDNPFRIDTNKTASLSRPEAGKAGRFFLVLDRARAHPGGGRGSPGKYATMPKSNGLPVANDTTLIGASRMVTLACQDASGGLAKMVPAFQNDAADSSKIPSAGMMAFNNSNPDRWRNNVEKTLLTSATRTVDTATATQTCFNGSRLFWILAISAFTPSGASPQLRVDWRPIIPTTGAPAGFGIGNAFAAATGAIAGVVGPGVAAAVVGSFGSQMMLPVPMTRRYDLIVRLIADLTDVTYSLGCYEVVG